MKKFLSLILALVLIFSLSVSSFAEFNTTDSSNLSTIRFNLGGSTSNTIYSALIGISNNILSTNTALGTANSYLSSLATNLPLASYWTNLYDRLGSIRLDLENLKIELPIVLGSIEDAVLHLEEVLADDDDKALKDDSKDNQLKAQDEFFGDGANSVSSDNLGSLSSLVSAFRSFLGDDIGLGNLDLAGWEEITSSDDPWQFFTDGDAVAESMGVSASPVSSPDFPDSPQGGGGGGNTPDIPDNPPDEDEFPNDGNVYVRCIGLENAYGSYPSILGRGQITDEFTVLYPGDIIEFALGIHKSIGYFVSINGVYFGYEDLNLGILEPYFTNNITLEFFKVPYSASVKTQYVYLNYRGSSVQSPPRLMSYRPDPNVVVTSYYEDNKNALWGWLD